MQSISVQSNMHSLLFSAALQNRLTACQCHCSRHYGSLLFIQVCSEPAPMHSISVQGKIASPLFSAALQNSLIACLCHCSHPYGNLLFTQMCSEPAPMHSISLFRARQLPHCSVLLCKTGSQHACVIAVNPMEVCSSYRCAVS